MLELHILINWPTPSIPQISYEIHRACIISVDQSYVHIYSKMHHNASDKNMRGCFKYQTDALRVLHGNFLSGLRQYIMTSSNGNIFRVTGHLCGEFTGPGEFPAQRPVTLMFSLICVWINGWVNNREAGDLIRYHAHYDAIVMNAYKLSHVNQIKKTQHESKHYNFH